MNRAPLEGLTLALPFVMLIASCSAPTESDAGRAAAGPLATEASGQRTPAPSTPPAPPPVRPALRGRVSLPDGASLSVESSADHGQAAMSFDLRDGEAVELLRSEIRRNGGAPSSYCEVKSMAGQGWIPEALLTDISWGTGVGSPAPRQDAPRVGTAEPIRNDEQHDEAEARRLAPASTSASASRVPDVLSVSPAGSDKPFDSSSLIVKGQYTIIDFFSEHCGPCRKLAPQLAGLATAHPRIVLRKVDIDRPGARGIDWGSPVVKQYGISSLPYVELYDTDGALVGTGQVALARLEELSRQP